MSRAEFVKRRDEARIEWATKVCPDTEKYKKQIPYFGRGPWNTGANWAERFLLTEDEDVKAAFDALNLATELLHVPDHQQDDEWYEKQKEVETALERIQARIREIGT